MATMVGRDQELAAVLGCLAGTDVALTLVLGEAGIGKSRLVHEAVGASPDRLSLIGGCLPMSHALPLLPVIDALDSRDPDVRRILTRAIRALPGSLRPHVAGVMPRTLPEEIQPAAEVRREQLFVATEALLSRVADHRPVTLVVEDVHWADPDTLDLLTYLAGTRHARDLRLLVTCRTGEVEMSEEVGEWLDTQGRSADVHELRLRPLMAADVRRLVDGLRTTDGAAADGRLAGTVFARGGGNPFFTEQLVASAENGERLPDRLAKLLTARVRATSSPAQEAVTALAVLGRPVPLSALRLVTLQDEETCLAAVRELVAGSLVSSEASGVRPRHALLSEALLAEQPGFPASYHHRVATALESLGDPATTPEIAEHLRLAGDEAAELRMAQRAAQRAWDLGAYAEAARWYQRTIDLHSRHLNEPLLLVEPEVVRRLLRALDLSGARREATELGERALLDFANWPNLAERLGLLSFCAHLVGVEDADRGLLMLEELLPQFDSLPPQGDYASTLHRIAAQQVARGDSRTGLAVAERALVVARAVGELDRVAHALARVSGCHRRLGNREAADRWAEEAQETARRSGDGISLMSVLIVESDNQLKYAEYEAAARTGRRGIDVGEQRGLQRSFHAQLLIGNAAEAHLALGQTVELALLVDGPTDRPLRPDDDMLSWLRAHSDLRRGRGDAARQRLLSDQRIESGAPESRRLDGEALAYVLLWSGLPTEALRAALEALPVAAVGDFSQDVGHLLSLGARAAADLAQGGDHEAATRGLRELEELREGLAEDPFIHRVTLPRGVVDGRQWQAELMRADGRAEPGVWADAAADWESLAMPHDAAYCWWREVEVLVEVGAEKRDLRTALHTAHRLAEGHVPMREAVAATAGRARIPVIETSGVDDAGRGHGLTAQETNVLRLLAAGLTNAEIGHALFISPKTASVHVSRILAKLGAANRTEAAAIARDQSLL